METFLIISNIGLWVFLAVQLVIVLMLTKLVAQFLNKFRGGAAVSEEKQQTLQIGQKAPLFREPDHRGEMIKLADAGGRYTLMLFTLETCTTCQGIIPKIGGLRELDEQLRLFVVSDSGKISPDKQIPEGAHYFRSSELMSLYHASSVPGYALVDPDGYIVSANSVGSFHELQKALAAHYQMAS